jgi:hypothetical protein
VQRVGTDVLAPEHLRHEVGVFDVAGESEGLPESLPLPEPVLEDLLVPSRLSGEAAQHAMCQVLFPEDLRSLVVLEHEATRRPELLTDEHRLREEADVDQVLEGTLVDRPAEIRGDPLRASPFRPKRRGGQAEERHLVPAQDPAERSPGAFGHRAMCFVVDDDSEAPAARQLLQGRLAALQRGRGRQHDVTAEVVVAPLIAGDREARRPTVAKQPSKPPDLLVDLVEQVHPVGDP